MYTTEYRDDQKEMEMKARWRPLVKQEIKQEIKQESESLPSNDHIPADQAIEDSRSRHQRHDSPEENRFVCAYMQLVYNVYKNNVLP